LLRLPNALRCRFTVALGILKQLEYNIPTKPFRAKFFVTVQSFSGDLFVLSNTFFMTFVTELLQNGILHYKSKELKHQKTPNFIVLSYHILFFKN
jgi:hypothetical protein